MTVQPFRARFDAMVAALRAHPQIEIYEVLLRPPALPADLRAAEEAIGMPLPADLRAFYEAHNGVFLEWGLRGRTYDNRTAPFAYPDYGQPPGCINLLPIADAMSPTWEAESHVNEITASHRALLFGEESKVPAFGSVCVDNFSKYNHGDLILGPEPVMVVSSDHGADMEASDWCSFSTYLELTLSIFGTNRYYNGMGIGWSSQPKRIEGWTPRATLDELVARVDD